MCSSDLGHLAVIVVPGDRGDPGLDATADVLIAPGEEPRAEALAIGAVVVACDRHQHALLPLHSSARRKVSKRRKAAAPGSARS